MGGGSMEGTYQRISPFLLLHLSGQLLPQPSPPDVHNHKGAERQTRRLDSQITSDSADCVPEAIWIEQFIYHACVLLLASPLSLQ